MSQPATWPPTDPDPADAAEESTTNIETEVRERFEDLTDAVPEGMALPSTEIDGVLADVRAAGFVITQEEGLIARDICRAADPEPFISGKSPTGLAAAALYAAAQLEAVRKGDPYANQPGPSERDVLTQREIGTATGVSEVTLRNTYKHMASLWASKADATRPLPDAYEAQIDTWRKKIDDDPAATEAV